MVRRECAQGICVCISYTGNEVQLGRSCLWNGRGGWGELKPTADRIQRHFASSFARKTMTNEFF